MNTTTPPQTPKRPKPLKPVQLVGEVALAEDAPEEIMGLPGMLSLKERQMLFALGRDHYSGNGQIIDAGSFMGCSTSCLAAGVKAGQQAPEKQIHAYELGILPAPANGQTIIRKFGDIKYEQGKSFVPILKDTIKPWWGYIDLNVGDILQENWDGDDIEICFVDVCKTPELNAHVTRQFFPSIPVGGYLVNQDFFFDRLPYVKVTMGYLSEYFEWVGRVYTSSIWRCVKQVPQDVADYDPYLEKDPKCREYHEMTVYDDLGKDALFMLDLSLSYLTGEGLDELEGKHHEFIEHNATVWEGREGKRRDARFRIERARKLIAEGNI